MSNFLLAFFGSLLAGLIGAIIDAKFRHPTATFEISPTRPFPHPILLRVSASAVIVAWLAILIAVALLVLGITNVWSSEPLFIGAIGSVIGAGFIIFPLAFYLRCPSCMKHLLVQWGSGPHFSVKRTGLDGKASIVLRVIMRKSFRCMNCGQTYAG